MYGVAMPMCVWRRHAVRHRRCKGVKVVGRRASPRHRKNYRLQMKSNKELKINKQIKKN